MGISLEELAADCRGIEVPALGDVIRIQYHPYVMTPEFEESLNRAEEATEGEDAPSEHPLLLAMEKLLVSWDLKARKEDAQPMPIAVANLKRVPLLIIRDMFRRIREDVSPNAEQPTGSFGA